MGLDEDEDTMEEEDEGPPPLPPNHPPLIPTMWGSCPKDENAKFFENVLNPVMLLSFDSYC